MSNPTRPPDLLGLAEDMVSFARRCGADEAEVTVAEGHEFSVDVRLGQVEALTEAGERHLSLRLIRDSKTAYASSSDLEEETLKRLVNNAVERSALASPDPLGSLPERAAEKIEAASLDLFDPHVSELEPDRKVRLALETERIALEDKRITNSHGASFATHQATTALANSRGFLGSYRQTFCSLSVGLQAGGTDERVEDYWYSAGRHFRDLESPESVARKAVGRTVRQLHPRKIPTQTVPVIFEPSMTEWLVGFLFACVSGVAAYQKLTFLAEKLGARIGNDLITMIDDGLMPGKLGSRPFDSEGVPSGKTTVIENGVLRSFICNTYAGRKLGLKTTGNADGTGVSPNNFYLASGTATPQDIIASTRRGLLLTRTIGHGLNPVTGDISRGAFGLWIEDGEIVHPVSEVTVSGNLGTILSQVEMVGKDLEFRSSVCGPTVKVAEMTVAGQ